MMAGGSIIMRNDGGYVACFYVKYTKADGTHETKSSGEFTLGVNREIDLPPGSTDIVVKAEENTGFKWSTIFVKEYSEPVYRYFQLKGTTLDPYYRIVDARDPKLVSVNVQVQAENNTSEDLLVENQTPDVGKVSSRMPETLESAGGRGNFQVV